MTIEEFLALVDHGRHIGKNEYSFSCPGPLHDKGDSHPSASVKAGDKGLLLHCFAGCTYVDICDALGIPIADLFYDSKPVHHRTALSAKELLEIIWREAVIVSIAAKELSDGKTLESDDVERLHQATHRIGEAMRAAQ